MPTVLSTGRIYNQIDISNNLSEEAQQFKNDSDEALFQVWQRSRVSQPTGFLCWMLFGLSVCLLFFWPMIQLYVDKNFRIATIFLFLGIFSAPRLYLNPVPILRSLGSMSNVDLPPRRQPVKSSTVEPGSARSVLSTILYHEEDTEDEYIMRKKAKLSSIVGTVNNRGSVCGWMWFFGILIIYAGLFALFAFSDGSDALDYKVKVPEGEVLLVDGFYYPGQPKLPYPTCSLSNHDFTLLDPDSPTRLMDVSFLAIMSFSAPEESTPFINHWFGEGQVVDNYEFVYNYRQEIDSLSGASYKLFSFPNNPGVGLVSIRGSESLLDWAVDVQLWTAAGLAQIIRGLIPLGWVWNPILDDLVYLINLVENENLKKISYYTQTTQFVNDLLSQKFGNYTKIRVTGASLGGGLAIITGAQTNASAVAISGLNAMLSRHTFSPPLTEEALNTHVFNVIPDRDPIAAVDDPGDLYQRTQCKAPFNSFFACHVRVFV